MVTIFVVVRKLYLLINLARNTSCMKINFLDAATVLLEILSQDSSDMVYNGRITQQLYYLLGYYPLTLVRERR